MKKIVLILAAGLLMFATWGCADDTGGEGDDNTADGVDSDPDGDTNGDGESADDDGDDNSDDDDEKDGDGDNDDSSDAENDSNDDGNDDDDDDKDDDDKDAVSRDDDDPDDDDDDPDDVDDDDPDDYDDDEDNDNTDEADDNDTDDGDDDDGDTESDTDTGEGTDNDTDDGDTESDSGTGESTDDNTNDDTESEIDTDGDNLKLTTIETRGFTFDARETISSGEPVLLLHGFPDTSLMWSAVIPVLSENGYHCLAPDQRGYSPGARPTEVDAYKYDELIADAFAFGSELGERFHLVAHDWGANVGWLMVEADPSPIASFTAISIPHYYVWSVSVYDDSTMSWYLSMLNTWMTEGEGEDYWSAQRMRDMWSAKPADQTEATIEHMLEPGAMTAALNWYRASDGHKSVIEDFDAWEVNVPTLLIHGSQDSGERSVTETEPLMTGPYRLERPAGGHFIVDEQPEIVAEEILNHLQENPL